MSYSQKKLSGIISMLTQEELNERRTFKSQKLIHFSPKNIRLKRLKVQLKTKSFKIGEKIAAVDPLDPHEDWNRKKLRDRNLQNSSNCQSPYLASAYSVSF